MGRPLATVTQEITTLLLSWSNGDQAALDQLIPLVYPELRRLARNYMNREKEGHTLQTSALINEAYLRLVDQQHLGWQNRAHFFAVSAQIMRRILIDHARTYRYQKRGGGAVRVSLDDVAAVNDPASDFMALDEALTRLAEIDTRKSQIVELRFFGGLTVEETAEVIKLAPITVMREWRAARAWLHRELVTNTNQSGPTN
jgi:RNA polymerase sigma factor (TIGR02999 family)